MHPTVSQYAEVLGELAVHTSQEKAPSIAEHFFRFLQRRGEEKKMAAIVKHWEKVEAEKDSRVSVAVVTASETVPATRVALAREAAKLFPEKQVALRYDVDHAVIGGVLFRTDEILYDATLATELDALKKSIAR